MTDSPAIEAGPYRAIRRPGQGGALLIAFASIGHDPSRPPSPEFQRIAAALQVPALFVTDAERSWASAPGFAELLTRAVAEARAQHDVSRIVTLGASMGGFAALRAAEVLPVDAVLAIGPQFRPAAPWEPRWSAWTRRLPETLAAPLPPGPWIALLHGLDDDTRQAEGFSSRAGVDHLVFAGLSHAGLARHLAARGGLTGLVEAALAGDRRRFLRIASAAGAIRRPTGPPLSPGPPDQLPR